MKLKKFLSFIICCILSISLIQDTACAYNLYNNDHKNYTITLDTSKTMLYFAHEDFSAATFSSMNEALYQWRQACGYNLMKRDPTMRHNLTNFTETSHWDGANCIYRVKLSDKTVVGRNARHVATNHIIYESDINFNMNQDFANSAMPNHYDAYSVFLHETGHSIGLEDITNPSSTERDSVMLGDWSFRSNSISWRKLRQDDINGAQRLY